MSVAERTKTAERTTEREGIRPASQPSAHPSSLPSSEALKAARRPSRATTAIPNEQTGKRARPMARRGSKVSRQAQERPMLFGILAASFGVSLAGLYVNAYARVTAAGLDQARLTREVRAAEQKAEDLRAQIDRLTLRSAGESSAAELKMEPNTSATVQLIAPPASPGSASSPSGTPAVRPIVP